MWCVHADESPTSEIICENAYSRGITVIGALKYIPANCLSSSSENYTIFSIKVFHKQPVVVMLLSFARTFSSLPPIMAFAVMVFHKPIRIYMWG